MASIVITPAAEAHFQRLIESQGLAAVDVRLAVKQKGTPTASVDLHFCDKTEDSKDDIIQPCAGFDLRIENSALPFLAEASIDFVENALGGELVIKAPALKQPAQGQGSLDPDKAEEQLQAVIESDINPMLASHGGSVALVRFDPDTGLVVLHFSGGCQGCGMAKVTLKQGIEKTLKAQLPFVQAVVDETDHEAGTQPYYR